MGNLPARTRLIHSISLTVNMGLLNWEKSVRHGKI